MKNGNKKEEILKEACFVGVDLAKKIFGVVVTDQKKKILQKKMVKRSDFLTFIDSLPKEVRIFMEGCGTSQFWARELQSRQRDVSIVPAQYVTPFVQLGKKNDLNDAMAVIEAGLRDEVHFVPVKTTAQRDLGSLVNRRDQLVENKIRLQNQIHAIFREAGTPLSENKTTAAFLKEANLALEFVKVTLVQKGIIVEMLEELKSYADKIETASEKLTAILLETAKEKTEEAASIRKMLSIYGVGPVTVATVFAHLGTLKQFANGRQVSSFLGLTPRQFSSGGKTILGSISKRGNAQIRSLLVLCAHSFLVRLKRLDQEAPLVKWLNKKMLSMNKKKLVVALANKLARILWAVSVKDKSFIPV